MTLTSTERTSRTTQPLQAHSSYEFTSCPKQTYTKKRGRPDPLEVVNRMPK